MPAQRFSYNPSQPIEDQLQTFLNGRNPFGSMGNSDWMNVNNSHYYSNTMGSPDESGTTNPVYQSLDPRVEYHPGADSNFIIDGQFAPVNWRDTTNPNGIRTASSATGANEWGGANPAGTGLIKPDDMYDYNNIYYDPTYGLVRDARDTRDPHAKQDSWINAGIMAAVGGLGGMAASAANAASGGFSFMGMQAPSLARTGLSAISSMNGARTAGPNPDAARPNAAALSNYGGQGNLSTGGSNVATNNGVGPDMWSQYGKGPYDNSGATDGSTGGASGGSTSSSGGFDLSGILSGLGFGNMNLGNLTQLGLSGLGMNQVNSGYKDDINRMLSVGTGGVTNNDRAGARNLVTGVYNGSIDPTTVMDRVPGLRALSQRGADDIGRQMSAHGDADPQSSARMREFIKFNNDLTSKAYGSEMDRAASIGGFGIDPSRMAGMGMQAASQMYGQNNQNLAGLMALANRGSGSPTGGNPTGGAAGAAGQSILSQIAKNPGLAARFSSWLAGQGMGPDSWGNMPNAGGQGWSVDTGMNDGPISGYDPQQGWNMDTGMFDNPISTSGIPTNIPDYSFLEDYF